MMAASNLIYSIVLRFCVTLTCERKLQSVLGFCLFQRGQEMGGPEASICI